VRGGRAVKASPIFHDMCITYHDIYEAHSSFSARHYLRSSSCATCSWRARGKKWENYKQLRQDMMTMDKRKPA
jgi:hypothetical protein